MQTDSKSESIWKNLVTADTQRERYMHTDPRYVPSQLNFFVASNRLYSMVPADPKSRRFELVFSDINSYFNHPVFQRLFKGKMDNQAAYFQFLYNGGPVELDEFLNTLANFLLHLPQDNWDPNVPMDSVLLAKNKENRFTRVQQYAQKLLERQYNSPFDTENWKESVPVSDSYDDFKQCMGKHAAAKKPFTDEFVRSFGCKIIKSRHPLHDVQTEFFVFRSLDECRDYFCSRFTGIQQIMADKENQNPNIISNSSSPEIAARQKWLEKLTKEEWKRGFIPACWRSDKDPLKVNFSLVPRNPMATTQLSEASLQNLKRKYTELLETDSQNSQEISEL